jgi:hypothetical protein
MRLRALHVALRAPSRQAALRGQRERHGLLVRVVDDGGGSVSEAFRCRGIHPIR